MILRHFIANTIHALYHEIPVESDVVYDNERTPQILETQINRDCAMILRGMGLLETPVHLRPAGHVPWIEVMVDLLMHVYRQDFNISEPGFDDDLEFAPTIDPKLRAYIEAQLLGEASGRMPNVGTNDRHRRLDNAVTAMRDILYRCELDKFRPSVVKALALVIGHNVVPVLTEYQLARAYSDWTRMLADRLYGKSRYTGWHRETPGLLRYRLNEIVDGATDFKAGQKALKAEIKEWK